MFITKKRHEAETEHLRDEISRLRGARMMDAETIRQQDERHRKAVKDLAAQSDEIAALRPDAEAMRAKRKRDRDQKAAKREAAA